MANYSKPHYQADPRAIKYEDNNKFKFYPRGLNITWGNDNRYWQLPGQDKLIDDGSVAELKQVAWLEVTGSTPGVVFGKSYKVGFRVSLRPDAFGWEGREVYIMAKIGKKGTFSYKKVNFEGKSTETAPFNIPYEDNKFVIKVDRPKENVSSDCTLYFGMYEVWSKKWKGGLKIHHAFVEMVDE